MTASDHLGTMYACLTTTYSTCFDIGTNVYRSYKGSIEWHVVCEDLKLLLEYRYIIIVPIIYSEYILLNNNKNHGFGVW